MRDVDVFVMDYFPASKRLGPEWLERGTIRNATDSWMRHLYDQCLSDGVHLNERRLVNEPFEDGLDFTVRARKEAFETSTSELFILADNDMLPFSAKDIVSGVETLEEYTEFAILSAWPEPHTIRPMELPEREAVLNDRVMEHYACGGFRFCRKFSNEVDMPTVRKPGYDGVFCRSLWDNYQMRVGYLRKSRAFHLGTHCTSLWREQS